MKAAARIFGGLFVLAGAISFVLAPFLSEIMFAALWGVEPLAYIGAVLMIAGLAVTSLSSVIPPLIVRDKAHRGMDRGTARQWNQVTRQYFELFDHDLGRPLRRILGKERQLQAINQSSGIATDPAVKELLDEIERQAPNFRLMMANIQVLVQLENPDRPKQSEAVEPSEVVRKNR